MPSGSRRLVALTALYALLVQGFVLTLAVGAQLRSAQAELAAISAICTHGDAPPEPASYSPIGDHASCCPCGPLCVAGGHAASPPAVQSVTAPARIVAEILGPDAGTGIDAARSPSPFAARGPPSRA